MKWEYKTLKWNAAAIFGSEDTLENDLNRLGKEGWELVSSAETKFRCGDTGTEQTDEVIFVLKRPLN